MDQWTDPIGFRRPHWRPYADGDDGRPRRRGALRLRHPAARCTAWGAVGAVRRQTSRDPDWRFDQHKAGYKASSSARRFGMRLLPELVEHLNPLRQWESLDLEAALADAFRAAGVPWVEGGH